MLRRSRRDSGRRRSAREDRRLLRRFEYLGVAFLDAGEVTASSDLDGIHFEAAEHEKLGKTVAEITRGLIG